MDWTLRMQKINNKIAKLNKVLPKDTFTVGACVISDYECSKRLMDISEQDWEKLLAELYKLDQKAMAAKVEMIVCYISELKRLAQVNLRELIGLTRDDVTALQRVSVMRKDATNRATRSKVIETLTNLVDLASEAEANDKHLERQAKFCSYGAS